MRKGVSGVRRLAAMLSVSMVAVLATGSVAGAATAPLDLSKYSAVGSGQVLNVKLTLPAAVVSALNGVLGKVSLPTGHLSLPQTIDETIGFSRSIGGMVANKVSGTSLGQMFHGSLDKPVLEPLVNTLFPERLGKGLPVANAELGSKVEHMTDSLKDIDVASIVHLGLMKVTADSTKVQNTAAAHSDASSTLANLRVDLTQQLKDLLKQVAEPLTNLTDNTLIPQLNDLLGGVTQTLNQTLGTTVNLQLPKINDLLDRPLLYIEKIHTASSTDAVGRLRQADGLSEISNIHIFGDSAENALVHINVLTSKAHAAIDGTKAGAKAKATQEIAKVSVLGNDLVIENNKITVLGKTIPVSLEQVSQVLDQVTGLIGQTLGLHITAFKTSQQASAMYAQASSQTLAISFHPQIAGLGELLGLDITAPNAMAEVAGDSVKGLCIGPKCNPLPTTGVPTTMYFVLGSTLLGATILVRRFALSH